MILICLGLCLALAGCGSNGEDPISATTAAGPIFRVEDVGNGIVRLTAQNSDLTGIQLQPVKDGPAEVPHEVIRARIDSVGTWNRVLNRWSLDADAPTEASSSFSDSDPVSAYVTDGAIYPPRRDIDVPGAIGTYVYTWEWENTSRSKFTHTIELVRTAGGVSGRHRYNDGPFTSVPMSPDTRILSVLLGMGLHRDAIPPSLLLTNFSDDALEQNYIGTWTVTEDMAGVVTVLGQFDLRMLALKNLRAQPANFDPALPAQAEGSSTTLRADVVALPYASANDADGWRPLGPVDWKVRLTNSRGDLVKTLTGSVNVTVPDSSGKVAEISAPWRGQQDGASTTLPGGSYSFQIQGLGPLGTFANTRTRPASGTVTVGGQKVNISVSAPPESFDPAAGGTTTLSFDLTTEALGDAPEISWTVSVVATGTNTTLHDFPVAPGSRGPGAVTVHSGTSLHVDLPWDGRHNNTPVPAEYTWVINASARNVAGGGDPVVAESRIANENDALTVIEIKADAAVPYLDENGQPIADATFYYSDSSPSSAHQLVLATDPNAAAATSGVSAKSLVTGPFTQKLVLVLERPDPATDQTFDVRMVDPDNPSQVLTDVYRLTFAAGQKRAPADLKVTPPKKVHKYPYLKVQTLNRGRWVDAKKNQTRHPVYYSPFGPPVQPFQNGEIVSQAAIDLAWEIEDGAETADGARYRAALRIGPWLKSKQFVYNTGVGKSGFPKGQAILSRQTFNFKEFMYPTMTAGAGLDFEGDCHDVASLEVMCCAAVGVEHALFDFVRGKGPRSNRLVPGMVTKPVSVFAAVVPKPLFEGGLQQNLGFYSFSFSEHEVAFWDNRAFSGLATILNAPGDAGLGSLAINAYVDAFLEGEQIDWDSAPFDVIPSSWITFTLPDRPPYADPRTGAEPIRLTAIDQ